MNKYIKNTLAKLLILLLVLIIAFVASVVLLVKEEYFKDIVNSCRVLVGEDLNNIEIAYEKGNFGNLNEKYNIY